MKKNILMLTGSPRRGGNSELLADHFGRGAEAKGHIVSRFDAAANPVSGCKACDACWTRGTACVFSDGFTRLAPMLEQADALILVSPLYWFGFSAQLKAAVDKIYSYMSPKRKTALVVHEAALLMCGEGEDKCFKGSLETFNAICEYMEWAVHGSVIAPHVNAKGDILGNKALEEAEKLGKSL